MLRVEEAQTAILKEMEAALPATVRLGAAALGLVLAEDIQCDQDSPPFDKAMMDGYAVRTVDAAAGKAELEVIEEVTAGRVAQREVGQGQTTRIMTGAPMPRGADAVVMVERTQMLNEGRVRIVEPKLRPGLNILARGEEMKAGQNLFAAGTQLRPQEIGVLGTIGRAAVKVYPRPRVTILSTGDEIVEVDQTPGPGQIRNSNGLMLLAQVARAGGAAKAMFIVPDVRERLLLAIRGGLAEADCVVLSGGVSAGKLDLVPDVLKEIGVTAHVHKVFMKPGKPMYFGAWHSERRGTSPPERKYVFGLPGNPVSSLVCFELFVRPALRKLRGLPPGPHFVAATLTEDYAYKTDRPTYHPARLDMGKDGWTVRPVRWFGSPDLRGTTDGNAFIVLEEGEALHRQGEKRQVLVTDDPG